MPELITTPLFVHPNLFSYYRLEGNSNDSKGANNGIDSNITYSTGNGKFNQGAGFNGSSSKIQISQMISGTGDFTINTWLNSSASGARQNILSQGAATNGNAFFFRINASGQLEFEVYGGTINSAAPVINDGLWHMATFVFASNTGKLYIDGALSGTFATTALNVSVSADYRFIGVEQATNWFAGALDDFSVFVAALNATQIQGLFSGQGAAILALL
jgi:hypothetical protein